MWGKILHLFLHLHYFPLHFPLYLFFFISLKNIYVASGHMYLGGVRSPGTRAPQRVIQFFFSLGWGVLRGLWKCHLPFGVAQWRWEYLPSPDMVGISGANQHPQALKSQAGCVFGWWWQGGWQWEEQLRKQTSAVGQTIITSHSRITDCTVHLAGPLQSLLNPNHPHHHLPVHVAAKDHKAKTCCKKAH